MLLHRLLGGGCKRAEDCVQGYDVFQQHCRYGGVFRGALANAQHILVASGVHSHRADDRVVAEDESADIKDEQLHVVEAPAEQGFDLRFRGLDRRPAHRRMRHPRRLGQPRNHILVVARGNAMQQDVQHPCPHGPAVLHGRADRYFYFLAMGALLRKRGRPTSSLRSLRSIWPGWRPYKTT